MTHVSNDLVTEYEAHEFCVDASDLRLPVGQYPTIITTDLGNSQPFVLDGFQSEFALYVQNCGCATLVIYAD